MEHEIHDLTAAYSLDALDVDERAAYEAHLPECPQCREELQALSGVTAALAVAASGPEPPSSLRDRVLGSARAEPQYVVPLASCRSRWTPVLGVAAAAAAVVAIGLGFYAISLSQDLDDTRTALEAVERTQAVLADPGARTIELQSGAGALVVGADGAAVLVLDDLEPAPAGSTYELWIVDDETPVPAGLFAGSGGRDVVPVEGTVPSGAFVAVTVEPEEGTDAPTTDPIAASQPA
jgi:anti-sigma-K factor RskA